MMKLIAETQAAGGVCAVIDSLHHLDTAELVAAGVKLDDLLISQPESREQASEIVDTLLRTGVLDLLVADCSMTYLPRTCGMRTTAVMFVPGVWL